MIVGVGTDVVAVKRLERALARVPRLRDRVFTAGERDLPPRSLAVRFAAKEAVAKALGSPGTLSWHDVTLVKGSHGEPRLVVTGACAALAAARGVDRWHVSLSHDGGMAVAFVVAEAGGRDA